MYVCYLLMKKLNYYKKSNKQIINLVQMQDFKTDKNMKNLTVKVENMTSNRGSEVPNQFVIKTNEGNYFQSYKSIIVFEPKDGKTQLDEKYWNYSMTTGKYRNQFLGEDRKETEAKIKSGEYVLTNLN